MAVETRPTLALYTDFGTDDPWVAEVKSALWEIQPQLKILDVTHTIPPHDIPAAAFALLRTSHTLPPWTIHFCIVDPGVGGARRPILVVADDHYYIGPDNGVFTYILEYEMITRVIHLNAEHYFRQPVCHTFHARDLFAPVAGWLAKGLDPMKLGDLIEDPVKVAVPMDRSVGDNLVKGDICAVDRFGNLITNVRLGTLQEVATRTGKGRFKVLVAGQELPLVPSGGYSQQYPLFALINSAGLVEIAGYARSAAQALGIGRGKEVGVMAE